MHQPANKFVDAYRWEPKTADDWAFLGLPVPLPDAPSATVRVVRVDETTKTIYFASDEVKK